MARHYATRDFFRQMPNPLLARYFHARGVFADLDIAAMPESQPDALWAAWLTLNDTQRHAMETAFQDIAALSGEKGYRATLDDAAWHFATDPAAHAAFVEQLASLKHHGARAFVPDSPASQDFCPRARARTPRHADVAAAALAASVRPAPPLSHRPPPSGGHRGSTCLVFWGSPPPPPPTTTDSISFCRRAQPIQVAQWANEQPGTELSRLPSADHRLCGSTHGKRPDQTRNHPVSETLPRA